MPGFFVSSQKLEFRLVDIFQDKCLYEELNNSRFDIKRNTLYKFLDDKLFLDNDKYVMITEGVILNKKMLLKKYGFNNFSDMVEYLYKVNGENFYAEFRGTFSGALFDKVKGVWLFYTNHVGDKPLFYYHCKEDFVVGSSVNYIYDFLKATKKRGGVDINESAIYDLLTYGFMASGDGNATLVKNIFRLCAGTYLRIDVDSNKYEIKHFHQFSNTKDIDTKVDENEIIEKIDEKFRNAIAMGFNKDLEYGYKSLVSLSGGFDSRMTTWVGSMMGYDMLNLTFSQSEYLDEKIASNLGNEWIYKMLDDAKFIRALETIVQMNFGLSHYMGGAHAYSLEQYINFENIGLWHTGQLGDVIVSSFCDKSTAYKNVDKVKGANSLQLEEKLDTSNFERYENEEMYMIYTRGFNGVTASQIVHANYTEMISPFLDVDFLEYCLSIPIEYREKHKLYNKWILKKYPEAAKFHWELINTKITTPKIWQIIRMSMRRGPYKLARILGIEYKKKDLGASMNPFNYWYASKSSVRKFMDEYYIKGIGEISVSDDLKRDMKHLYEKGNAKEKSLVLTAIAGIKKYH